MWDALTTARGKPGSPLKILLIGTLAPALSGWWAALIEDGLKEAPMSSPFAATPSGGTNGLKSVAAIRSSRRSRTAARCSRRNARKPSATAG